MKIAIGCDHIATETKNELMKHLQSLGHKLVDCGSYNEERTHYAIYGHAVAVLTARKEVDFGIVICGTGVGISNSANKTKNIRAVLTHHELVAQKARELYDANVLCMGGRVTGIGTIINVAEVFLKTKYLGKNKPMISRVDKLIKHDNLDLKIFDNIIKNWQSGVYTNGEKQAAVDLPKCSK